MSKRFREKIALVVFVALVAFAGCCLGGYLLAGHSWNVAASSLDDTFGSMDGYVVIVYEGTAVSQTTSDTSSVSASEEENASDSAVASNDGEASDSAAPSADGEAFNSGLASSSNSDSNPNSNLESAAATDELLDGESDTDAAGADVLAAEKDDALNVEAEADAAEEETGDAAVSTTDAVIEEDATDAGATESDAASNSSDDETTTGDAQDASSAAASTGASSSSTKDPVTADEVRASYEDKNAEVLVLDSANSGKYCDGAILKKGGYRFGVFSVDEDTTAAQIKKQVKYFENHQVDFVVALTSDKELLEDAASGIDIVISTQDEGLFAMGETQSGTFFVDSPAIGSVGVILISPSNVVSAKVINEL